MAALYVLFSGATAPDFTGTCVVGSNHQVTFRATDVNAGDTLTFTISHTGGTVFVRYNPAAFGRYSDNFSHDSASGAQAIK